MTAVSPVPVASVLLRFVVPVSTEKSAGCSKTPPTSSKAQCAAVSTVVGEIRAPPAELPAPGGVVADSVDR